MSLVPPPKEWTEALARMNAAFSDLSNDPLRVEALDALAKVIDKAFEADEARARALPTPIGLLANLNT